MSVRFTATGQAYTANTGSFPSAGTAHTTIFWARVGASAVSQKAMAYGLSDTADLAIGTNASSQIEVYNSSGAGESITGATLSANTWYKIAFTMNGTTGTLYAGADGASLSTTSDATFTAAAPVSIEIGTFVGGELWDGRIAALKTYNAVLTQTEIETELASFEPIRTTSLQRYYPFHVPSITDGSGGGNNLTIGAAGPLAEADPPIRGAVNPPLFVSDRGNTANATAGTTSSVTITSPTTVAVGNYLVARVAVDNSGTSGAAPGCTVTDPRSNTWTVLGPALADPGAAAAGATAYLCYTRVGTAYQAADALTFNWGGISTTAKAIVVEEWTNIHSAAPVAVSAVTNDSVAAGSTTAVAATVVPTDAYQLVYTCLATEGIAGDSITYDTDTTNGLWSPLTRVASANATATNNQCVAGQQKVVTASGSQTWNATITSRDWAAIAVVFAPGPYPSKPTVANQAALHRANSW